MLIIEVVYFYCISEFVFLKKNGNNVCVT